MNPIARSLYPDKAALYDSGHCTACGYPIPADLSTFTDDLSRKEYRISGMCQICQDEVFND